MERKKNYSYEVKTETLRPEIYDWARIRRSLVIVGPNLKTNMFLEFTSYSAQVDI